MLTNAFTGTPNIIYAMTNIPNLKNVRYLGDSASSFLRIINYRLMPIVGCCYYNIFVNLPIYKLHKLQVLLNDVASSTFQLKNSLSFKRHLKTHYCSLHDILLTWLIMDNRLRMQKKSKSTKK